MRRVALLVAVVGACFLALNAEGTRAAATLVVTTAADSNGGTCTAQDCSLRNAVLVANQNPDQTTILVPEGIYRLTLDFLDDDAQFGDLDITSPVTITGDVNLGTTIDGQGLDRVFDVMPGASLTLDSIDVANGRAAGGGIRTQGALTLNNVLVDGNESTEDLAAGGVTVGATGSATITSSFIDGNFSSVDHTGGGIYVAEGGELTLTDSEVLGNNVSAPSSVGGVWLEGDGDLTNVRIADNGAAGDSSTGGIFSGLSATTNIDGSLIKANTATTRGVGGVSLEGVLTIRDTVISANQATENSTGGVQSDGDLTMQRVHVVNNIAGDGTEDDFDGAIGGVFLESGTLASLTDVSIDSNTGSNRSIGGLRNWATTSFLRGSISRNKVGLSATTTGDATIQDGPPVAGTGGLYNLGAGNIDLTSVTISENQVGGTGAISAINNDATAPVNLNHVTIAGNVAAGGAAVRMGNSVTEGVITNTIIGINDPVSCISETATRGNNIDAGHTCGFIDPTDRQDTDPLLGPLQDNGGNVLTHDLLEGSPAIDTAGVCPPPESDARRIPRPQGNKCDVGALEVPVADSPAQRTWGDVLCDGTVGVLDALEILSELGQIRPAIGVAGAGCPAVRSPVSVSMDDLRFAPLPWGDTDCSSILTGVDALAILRNVAGTTVTPVRCYQVGDTVSVGGS